jgi:hypothetical protein
MSTKTLLIILVLIAIIVGVAIGRGQRKQKSASDTSPDSAPGTKFFSGFSGGGDTLVMARLVGCGRQGKILRFAGICDAHILPAKERMSRFVLKAFSNTVRACYGFQIEDVEKCHGKKTEEKGLLKPDGTSRFVVAKDGAFLRLYCYPLLGGSSCVVTVE